MNIRFKKHDDLATLSNSFDGYHVDNTGRIWIMAGVEDKMDHRLYFLTIGKYSILIKVTPNGYFPKWMSNKKIKIV